MEKNKIDWGSWEDNQSQTKPETKTSNDKPFEIGEVPTSWGDSKPDVKDPNSGTKKELMEEWGYENTSTWSFLGTTKNIELNPELYMFDVDNQKALDNIDLNNLEPFDDGTKYKLDSSNNEELTKILSGIKDIGAGKGLNLGMFYLIKNVPRESSVNIFRGKPKMNFIYVLNGDKSSGNFILDLSALGGPSSKLFDTQEGILVLFEGWVPYRVTKNLSEKDLLIIAGDLN